MFVAEVGETNNIDYILLTLPQEFVKAAFENQRNSVFTLNFVIQRPLHAEALLLDSKKVKVHITISRGNILKLNVEIGLIFKFQVKMHSNRETHFYLYFKPTN